MKVLIADDHWMVRESLKQVIRRLHKALDVYEAGTFGEALTLLRSHADIDLMLVDLIMPGFEEFEGLQKLRREFPEVPVVVVSVHDDIEHVLRAVEHGVIGYIPKSASGPEIERSFERVLAGEVSFPRHIIETAPRGRERAPTEAAPPRSSDRSVDTLTNRERDVLALLGKGYSVSRIATDLGLSSHTVRVHLGNLMKKLGLRDRSSAIHYAVNLANLHRQAEQQ
ncbi:MULTISPECIES: response regulator transcription factor [unclassified Mesorhizobium]|uniref:response regulator n=1 Tax=unclassified Mesorhizobium TaxID=325217 RepID=UPI000BAF9580|nr:MULTISPECIES: response regulator transcription factor [unclassified Mesorhizobium]AZO07714.1 response regulator transcription factor [Mesorhizobium sp. M3A.F.Ca.ET.080.04.2.1]PBB84528.1 DNA-binding response regulator [Mesorhizobium sp. WSM3876]RWF15695.1 MAG: response regulator transcription factor [Mesorhizobium sp.]